MAQGNLDREASPAPLQFAFPLPKAPDTTVHAHLTINPTSILLFLSTTQQGDASSLASLGSFVYALPDNLHAGQTLSTVLYSHEATLEFTQRMAKLVAKKSRRPAYVVNSISFAGAGLGGTVEEEMEGFKKVVDVVMAKIHEAAGEPILNGH